MVSATAVEIIIFPKEMLKKAFPGFFSSEVKKRGFRLPPFSIAYSDRKCLAVPGQLGKRIKSALP
jgi:hypothetical protein